MVQIGSVPCYLAEHSLEVPDKKKAPSPLGFGAVDLAPVEGLEPPTS